MSMVWRQAVKSSRNHRRQTDMTLRRTVRADTCSPANVSTSWLRAWDAAIRSIQAMRVRRLSSQQLGIMSCWDPERRSVWSCWSHGFNILQRIMESRSSRSCDAISHNPSKLQFDLYQSQTRVSKHFYLHEASQQFFITQQQFSNVVCWWEICWTT